MSSATVPPWPQQEGQATPWERFHTWRHTRPFWGGLLAILAGGPILYFPYFHLKLGQLTMAMSTTAGAGSLVIGLLLIALGLTAWFQPLVRVFCGVATTILSLISIPVSNFGGFLLGFLLGLVGGGLLLSWAPLKPEPVVEAVEGAEFAAEQPAGSEPAAAEVAEAVDTQAADTHVLPAQPQAADPEGQR
ncbi:MULTISPECIES: DUF6114 domain-containing protein [unclassified Kitasatospora]|uniref:DUF6114 domain-containing protein n=1 Tax=unclassified Kitasatospora TaxID=2633591 RepID=UPI00070E49C8|nr:MULTISPECIES: DUF6114 domain-containing protein [unclassified Kitasatospora]KQV23676.1 hypothetical protein ASC99_00050 [Kitasatospora sp. Root107]KRB67611.1 hypothetical protein ASE03_04685 [Kitasatospora sp. Root187]